MDDAVLGHLRDALVTHTPMVYEESTLTRNVLKDLCGPDDFRGEIWVLVGAVSAGIPTALADAKSHGLPPTLGDRLVRKLRHDLAMDHETARWAVTAWASALKITGLYFAAAPRKRPSPGVIALPGPDAARQRIAGLANRAKQIATAIPVEKSKAVALGMAATALAATDDAAADRLLDEAELLVQSITNENAKTRQWHDLSATVADTYPGRAENLARLVQGPLADHAVGCLVSVLADTDVDHALRLAWSINDENVKMYTLAGLVAAIADTDPDRAARLAETLTGEYWKAEALCQVAATLAADDPARASGLLSQAEGLARSVEDRAGQVAALSSVGKTLAAIDPDATVRLFDEAEHLAQSVEDEAARASALGTLAIALAVSDTDRALRLAQSLADDWYATGEIARMIAHRDPNRALSIAQAIRYQTPHLADIAVALSAADPDCAQRLAWSITTERWQAAALVGIARVMSASDPARAMRLLEQVERRVDQMTDDLDKVIVLVDVAAAWAEN